MKKRYKLEKILEDVFVRGHKSVNENCIQVFTDDNRVKRMLFNCEDYVVSSSVSGPSLMMVKKGN